MDTISPVVADAFHLLHRDLYGHLDEAEFLALKCREWSQQDADTGANADPRPGGRDPRDPVRARGAAQWQLPDLPVGVALPGGDDDPRAGEGSGPRVRRARPPGGRGEVMRAPSQARRAVTGQRWGAEREPVTRCAARWAGWPAGVTAGPIGPVRAR